MTNVLKKNKSVSRSSTRCKWLCRKIESPMWDLIPGPWVTTWTKGRCSITEPPGCPFTRNIIVCSCILICGTFWIGLCTWCEEGAPFIVLHVDVQSSRDSFWKGCSLPVQSGGVSLWTLSSFYSVGPYACSHAVTKCPYLSLGATVYSLCCLV